MVLVALIAAGCFTRGPLGAPPDGTATPEAARVASVDLGEPPRADELVVARSATELPRGYAQRATADISAGYGGTTAPVSIVEGGDAPVEVRVTNTGREPWPASGPDPVRLSYHWYDANGSVVVWDGPRVDLPSDVLPGRAARFTIDVRAPRASGTFFLDWDLVQEHSGWFSTRGIAMKAERIAIAEDGVTFYGKGWGHGIGLSQWGAQGSAEGAAGPLLSGEQIVAKYFPGAELASHPSSLPIRVLLSAPSTGCVRRTIDDYARMYSAGGMRLVNDGDATVIYADVDPDEPLTFYADGATLVVRDEWSGATVVEGPGAVTLVPKRSWDPIAIDEKGLSYRGNLKISTRDGGYLRVVNYVSSDDYMKGALPGEMPNYWEMEALRAQAITARTYAAWRQSTAGERTWDVRDDTADQCYGGRSFESLRTTAAVESTASKILLYDGTPIRALYSSAHGGVSENVGCVLDAVKAGITWRCADGWPYLAVVEDPAELAAYDIRGPNPHDALWSQHFSGEEIRAQIIESYGLDIGHYVSMEFDLSPGGRPVSVRVRGTDGWVDLKGDRFLRQTLGLKSTLVRAIPF